ITQPEDPTRRASSTVKKPIPGPGSSTVMPSRTWGERMLVGFCPKRRNGFNRKYPSHQGQTRWAIFVPGRSRLRPFYDWGEQVAQGESPTLQVHSGFRAFGWRGRLRHTRPVDYERVSQAVRIRIINRGPGDNSAGGLRTVRVAFRLSAARRVGFCA